MTVDTLEVKVITPKDGCLLTNGETTSKCVYLGVVDSPEAWWEIPDPEYEAAEGTYLNPIYIPVEGITTESGKWYYVNDKELPHEAKEYAFVTYEDFNNSTWFEFVE